MPAPISAQSARSAGGTPNLPSFTTEMAVIAAGGSLGASLRHGISLAIGAAQWPAVLAVASTNVLGAFLLGLIVGYLETGKAHPLLRPFLTIGVFGSFTTFSALAFDNRALADESGETIAAVHLAVSILAGLVAFVVGDALSGRLFDHRGGR